jgi:hypothetical protein
MKGQWVVALYPRRWRERYGEELRELIAAEGLSIALVLDVLAGAIDAWIHREYPLVLAANEKEGPSMSSLFAASDSGRSAWDVLAPLGVLLAYVVVWLTSRAVWGDTPATEAFTYAGLGAACMAAYAIQSLRRHSHAAKAALIAISLVVFYGISLLATWMAYQI